MLGFRLSGGSSNAIAGASLGGAMSSTPFVGEIASWFGNAPSGVTILGSHNNQPDDSGGSQSARLRINVNDAGAHELIFTPYGIAAGTVAADKQNYRGVLADGIYNIPHTQTGRSLTVSVVKAMLPGSLVDAPINVSRSVGALFPSTTATDASESLVDYRCVYLLNEHPRPYSVWLYLARAALSSMISIGLEPVGTTAQTIASGADAPAAITFSRPSGSSPIALALPASTAVPVWIRRGVNFMIPVPFPEDAFVLTARAY